MICFEIVINGNKVCTAGVDAEYGVLSSILTWVKRDLRAFPAENKDLIQDEELNINVAGHIRHGRNDFENLEWIKQSLSPGDEINIRIIESPDADTPSKRHRSGPGFVDKRKREYFENHAKSSGKD